MLSSLLTSLGLAAWPTLPPGWVAVCVGAYLALAGGIGVPWAAWRALQVTGASTAQQPVAWLAWVGAFAGGLGRLGLIVAVATVLFVTSAALCVGLLAIVRGWDSPVVAGVAVLLACLSWMAGWDVNRRRTASRNALLDGPDRLSPHGDRVRHAVLATIARSEGDVICCLTPTEVGALRVMLPVAGLVVPAHLLDKVCSDTATMSNYQLVLTRPERARIARALRTMPDRRDRAAPARSSHTPAPRPEWTALSAAPQHVRAPARS